MTDVSSSQDAPDPAGTGIDTTVPHSARIWNYWLGGKDNYAVDREAGDQYKEIFPGIAVVARTSRGFLTRAVRYLAGEAGASLRELMDRMGHSITRAALICQHRTSLRDKMIADEISRRAEAERSQSGTQRAQDNGEAS